jgi:ferredoxin
MAVTVTLDPVRCAGHGLCALLLDDRVTLDEWGYPKLDPTPLPAGRGARRARRAARACPRQALLLNAVPDGASRSTVRS